MGLSIPVVGATVLFGGGWIVILEFFDFCFLPDFVQYSADLFSLYVVSNCLPFWVAQTCGVVHCSMYVCQLPQLCCGFKALQPVWVSIPQPPCLVSSQHMCLPPDDRHPSYYFYSFWSFYCRNNRAVYHDIILFVYTCFYNDFSLPPSPTKCFLIYKTTRKL